MKTINIISALLVASVIGCVSATAEVESVCSSGKMPISFASSKASAVVGERTVTKTFDEDFSDALSKFNDIGSVSIKRSSLSVNGDVSFIRQVDISLHSVSLNQDVSMVNTTIIPSGSNLTVPINVDNGKLYSFLNSGKVILTVSLTGVLPQNETNLDSSFCVGLTSKIDKAL